MRLQTYLPKSLKGMGKQSSNKKKKSAKAKLPEFDKYHYYKLSVQSPEADVEFIRDMYRELRDGKSAQSLREDFCGTFSICCEWVKLDPKHRAVGVDLDPEPLEYGFQHNYSQLSEGQKKRLQVLQKNVLDSDLPSVDVIAAMNFSYFIFKQRQQLKNYFSSCFERLNKNGLFLVDCFGGGHCTEANEEETEHKGFSYFWDQDSFDPVSNEAMFYIHFKRKGEKKREKVFSYDWRMWGIPELRDLMAEVGFKKTHVYWEGTDKNGEGDGVFTRTETGEECQAWVAYVVGEK